MRRTVVLSVSWALVAVCAAVIFALSNETATQSSSKSDGVIAMLFARFGIAVTSHFVRKLAHALEYFGLAILLYNAYGQSFRAVQPTLTVLTTMLYAASDELHQYFIAGRACQLRDVLVDTLGAVAGVALCTGIYWLIHYIFKKKGT
ncbi:MAG: VanZ family protein [Candidatus Fimenecus sp.]